MHTVLRYWNSNCVIFERLSPLMTQALTLNGTIASDSGTSLYLARLARLSKT